MTKAAKVTQRGPIRVAQLADERPEHARDHRHRSEHERRECGVEAAGDLEVEGERHRHRRDADPDEEDRGVRDREVAVAEESERHERLGAIEALPQHEEHQQHGAGDDQSPHRDRTEDHTPVVDLALLDAEHQQEEAESGQGDAEPVEAMRVPLEIGHQTPGDHEGDDADRNVDEEDPLPTHSVGEHAAEDRTDERRQPSDCSPRAMA